MVVLLVNKLILHPKKVAKRISLTTVTQVLFEKKGIVIMIFPREIVMKGK